MTPVFLSLAVVLGIPRMEVKSALYPCGTGHQSSCPEGELVTSRLPTVYWEE